MDKNLFSGLENLGIDNIDDIGLFNTPEEKIDKLEAKKIELSLIEKQKTHIFDKEVKCPVCAHDFKVKIVKSSSQRIKKKHSDFCVDYDVINPYFYDVWLCNYCGYSNMKADFGKIKEYQKALISLKVTSKWQGKTYPEVYDVAIAIERYKLALYNCVVIESVSSRKAMNCLKIAWMYRLTQDKDNEFLFLSEAIKGFNDAFVNESTPIYGMNNGTLMYLIGELYRRVNDFDNANLWFSKLITSNNAEQKIKEMSRTQRDLIKEVQRNNKKDELEAQGEDERKNEKKGFFSRFFN